jgi:lipoprotein NlpD
MPVPGRHGGWLTLVCILALLAGCRGLVPAPVEDHYGPAPPGFYRIRQGDTLSEIAERQRIPLSKLVAWNDLEPPHRIYAGRLLRMTPPEPKLATMAPPTAIMADGPMPPASTTPPAAKSNAGAQAKRAEPPKTLAATPTALKPQTRPRDQTLNWRWPLKGKVTQDFAPGDPRRQGIRIAGQPGTAVAAAEAGEVVYAGSGLPGYGNLIILKHKNDYLTTYGFNRRMLVEEGARVRRGEPIAEMGQGPDGTYLLHFEIRRDGTATDPADYLPAQP